MENAPEQSDYLAFFSLVLSFVQMIALGPKFYGLHQSIEETLALSLLEFDRYTNFRDGVYYYFLSGYFGVALMIILITLYYWKLIDELIIPYSGFVSGVKSIIDTISPMFLWFGLGGMMASMTEVFS
jgi:hypothetical protein